jgi:hypothetical protein
MTMKQFQSKVEAAFLKANPTATITGWLDARLVKYPTGVRGWAGKFHAIADGYKPRVMIAQGDDTYIMVR